MEFCQIFDQFGIYQKIKELNSQYFLFKFINLKPLFEILLKNQI
ncbi:hypothetical protein pb186bvf_000900 [Paramecium bursaria]